MITHVGIKIRNSKMEGSLQILTYKSFTNWLFFKICLYLNVLQTKKRISKYTICLDFFCLECSKCFIPNIWWQVRGAIGAQYMCWELVSIEINPLHLVVLKLLVDDLFSCSAFCLMNSSSVVNKIFCGPIIPFSKTAEKLEHKNI